MIDAGRRYTFEEVAVLGEQGYEFVEISLISGETFFLVTGLNPNDYGVDVTNAFSDRDDRVA